ncbi:VQ motif-containing protein 25-like [Amaranthus tricolor]|uniref:VQ motif-containing protein 25-like n=1 Tax=Amaranthus tricolor TaxID=29722 RepID=UPI002590B306|nr:VQ motif-containing protein 25-like [Amaranthus tricolor]
MTHLFNRQSTMINPTTSLSMHKDSRVISKTQQPKIRIIHIFAPEIIKTDVANFRELVQRLTGNSSSEKDAGRKRRIKGKGKMVKETTEMMAADDGCRAGIGCDKLMVNPKLECMMGSGSYSSPSSSSDHHQQHDGGWRSTAGDHNISSGGFLNGFNDLDNYSFDFNSMFHNLGNNDGSTQPLFSG